MCNQVLIAIIFTLEVTGDVMSTDSPLVQLLKIELVVLHAKALPNHWFGAVACYCKFSSPLPGVLNCSISIWGEEGLHVTQLPILFMEVASCHLLRTDGLTILLGASLTECNIIIHWKDISNLAMVAETVLEETVYPLSIALPYCLYCVVKCIDNSEFHEIYLSGEQF
jgi:hypothetical protein